MFQCFGECFQGFARRQILAIRISEILATKNATEKVRRRTFQIKRISIIHRKPPSPLTGCDLVVVVVVVVVPHDHLGQLVQN